mmetsp:Transcript_38883/g.59088  ORF Transcript_38883/g.59088 Transcript_38883/m.59088 type:complete len:97 (+) Transcript_38883:1309-1599(+)
MSLLPQRDARAIINRLLQEGYIETVMVPKSNSASNDGAKTFALPVSQMNIMYGVRMEKVRQMTVTRMLQSLVNMLSRYGELGRLSQVSKEVNILME